MKLLPPFAYLKEVTDRVRKGSGFEGKIKTSAKAGQCSSLVSLSDVVPGEKMNFDSGRNRPAHWPDHTFRVQRDGGG
jgi:hypothetical protein